MTTTAQWVVVTFIAATILLMMIMGAAAMQAKDEGAPGTRFLPLLFILGTVHALAALAAVLGAF